MAVTAEMVPKTVAAAKTLAYLFISHSSGYLFVLLLKNGKKELNFIERKQVTSFIKK